MNDTIKAAITADGKCLSVSNSLRQIAKKDGIETIEIMIDGTQLMPGKHPLTLLGEGDEFLPLSRRLKLTHFEPLSNGQCKAIYARRVDP